MEHEVVEYKLPSGARGLVIDVPGVKVVELETVFNSGYVFADHQKFEVPHVMEHLMGSGNKRYPTAIKFKTEVEKNGAYRNAYTDSYTNGYVYECAAFESERMLELLIAQMSGPLFPELSFPTEISNVREELTGYTTNYARQCYMQLAELATPAYKLNYAKRIEQLPSITRQDLVDHYKSTHNQSNLTFFLAGDFGDGGKAMVRRLEQGLKTLPQGKPRVFPDSAGEILSAPVVGREPIKQLFYQLHFYLDGGCDERQIMAMALLSNLLTGGYKSWIHGQARERGLAYHVSSSFNRELAADYFLIDGNVTPGNAMELYKLITRCVTRAAEGKISAEDLRSCQDLRVGQLTRGNQTAGRLLRWYGGPYLVDGVVLDFDSYLANLQTVTVEDVVQAAQRVIRSRRAGVSLVGDVDEKLSGGLYAELDSLWNL